MLSAENLSNRQPDSTTVNVSIREKGQEEKKRVEAKGGVPHSADPSQPTMVSFWVLLQNKGPDIMTLYSLEIPIRYKYQNSNISIVLLFLIAWLFGPNTQQLLLSRELYDICSRPPKNPGYTPLFILLHLTRRAVCPIKLAPASRLRQESCIPKRWSRNRQHRRGSPSKVGTS